MNIQIKNRWTRAVLHEGDYVSLMEAIADAVKSRADLSGANLSRADLSGANLSGANLSRADLYGANLSGANLSRADLSSANLSRADLSRANLYGANLSGANLSRADLSGANLSRANLDLTDPHARLSWMRTRILPDGDLIGWKKANRCLLVKLKIPSEAKRSHAFGRKCRCEFADVLAIYNPDGSDAETATTNAHGPTTVYRVGQRVTPNGFDEDWRNECSTGIHFFITKEEAMAL